MLNIISWNINGIRAAIKKGFWQKVQQLDPDILCLQEIKCDEVVMQNLLDSDLSGFSLNYELVYHIANNRKGYSGTAILYKVKGERLKEKDDLFTGENEELANQKSEACTITSGVTTPLQGGQGGCFGENQGTISTFTGLNNPKFDIEGRITGLNFEFFGHKITLINGYYPQGGREGRVEYKIEFYAEVLKLVQKLQLKGQKVILTGDFNTTFGDIDLARPKENRKTTGCLPEEREALNWFVKEVGLIDSFRYFHPEQVDAYTYWDQITRARERNVGWRIDMFLVDQNLLPILKQAQIHPQIEGSDHCPVEVGLE